MFTNIWNIMRGNKFQFDNELSNDLICEICKCLMIKACNAPCGCRYCSDCIEHYLDGNDKFCPTARKYCQMQKINFANNIVIDNHANIRIAQVVVGCPRENCEFKDELGMIENHMRTCDKRPISCPFSAIGCDRTEVMSDEIKVHLNDDNYSHSKLLIDLINNLLSETESMKNENIELKTEITNLKRENSQFRQQVDNIELQSTNQQQKIREMERKEIDYKGEIERLNGDMMTVKNDYQSLRMEMATKIGSVNQMRQQIEMIETKSQQQIDKLKENYELQQQEEHKKFQLELEKCANKIRLIQTKFENEKIIHFGFFEWQIDKLSQRRRNKYIYSQPFYSDQFGYKMCLAVIIWDNGGIYFDFQLMAGESDDKLEWPFKCSVTINVIDPGNGNICHCQTIKYSDNPNDAGWTKPLSDRNKAFNIFTVPNNSPAIKNDKLTVTCRVINL